MKKLTGYLLLGVLAISLVVAGCGGAAQPPAPKAAEAPKPVELHISAAVSMKDALDGCERILNDEFRDLPESALYMIGAVDEAMDKARGKAQAGSPSKPAAQPAREEAHAVDDA